MTQRNLVVVSNSEMYTYRQCPRKHQYRYRMMRRTRVKAAPLEFGGIMHDALEMWFNGYDIQDVVSFIQASDLDEWKEKPKLLAMVVGHCAFWSKSIVSIEIETEFAVPIKSRSGNDCHAVIRGKLDGIVMYNGKCYVLEHKSTSSDISPGSEYWQQLLTDSQASTYILGARSLGYDPVGVLYNVLRKPLHRRSKSDMSPSDILDRMTTSMNESPQKYWGRQEIVRTEFDLQEAENDLYDWYKRLRSDKTHPRNVNACFDFHRPCEYHDVCTGADRIENEIRYRTADKKHEELS